MSTKIVYVCDYCGKEQKEPMRENPQITLISGRCLHSRKEWLHLCDECQELIKEKFDEFISSLGDNCNE